MEQLDATDALLLPELDATEFSLADGDPVHVFGLFAVRLVQLQGLDSSRYATMASSERRLQVTLPSIRGPILDTNGVPLATTVDAVDLFRKKPLRK